MQYKNRKQVLFILAFAVMGALFSCSNQKTTTDEEVKIERMDSVSTNLKKSSAELEDQTKKVEKALEDVDKEFENNK
ncbi:MAG: hypothetical protein ABIT96_13925 [Ferruginibacter sp.]